MDDEFSHKTECDVTQAAIDAGLREYQAMRRRRYDDAIARLESSTIEPAQQAAYEATLAEISMIPVAEAVWPDDDPRYNLHHAMEYGNKLLARRSEVEERFGGSFPLAQLFSIGRYALAALHAFKAWRSNPEPEHSFGKLLRDASRTRSLLRASAAMLIGRGLIGSHKVRHFDGGLTPEGMACDLFLLAGALREVVPKLSFRLLEPTELMEAELIANSLLRRVTSGADRAHWQPTLLYAQAYTLIDRACFQAELVLSELHNEERDTRHELEWIPQCLFCECRITQQRHHRHSETPAQQREHAQFMTSTMTAVLGRNVVAN